ncbi:MAG: GreA/GreB family elongation factor [Patescibacteria group bacterium]|nr:GreA/GreB family elongation factor [Patescibacteria group bacterium]
MSSNYTVNIGDKVKVILDGAIRELEIVDVPTGDPKHGVISYLSPLARALLGKRYPSQVTVKLPNGNTLECRLLSRA